MKRNVKLLDSIWYEIDKQAFGDDFLYLMESQVWGDNIPCIIIDKDNKIIMKDVYNGFEELDYDKEYCSDITSSLGESYNE
jgi:hypothetical protein